MFTIEQIKTAHAKVKSGADYPAYVQEIIDLGVIAYETLVTDGNTEYQGNNNYKTSTGPKYDALPVSEKSDKDLFLKILTEHQAGKTDFPTFCLQCAESGIEKWIVDITAMTCTYYDRAGNKMLTEDIPYPS